MWINGKEIIGKNVIKITSSNASIKSHSHQVSSSQAATPYLFINFKVSDKQTNFLFTAKDGSGNLEMIETFNINISELESLEGEPEHWGEYIPSDSPLVKIPTTNHKWVCGGIVDNTEVYIALSAHSHHGAILYDSGYLTWESNVDGDVLIDTDVITKNISATSLACGNILIDNSTIGTLLTDEDERPISFKDFNLVYVAPKYQKVTGERKDEWGTKDYWVYTEDETALTVLKKRLVVGIRIYAFITNNLYYNKEDTIKQADYGKLVYEPNLSYSELKSGKCAIWINTNEYGYVTRVQVGRDDANDSDVEYKYTYLNKLQYKINPNNQYYYYLGGTKTLINGAGMTISGSVRRWVSVKEEGEDEETVKEETVEKEFIIKTSGSYLEVTGFEEEETAIVPELEGEIREVCNDKSIHFSTGLCLSPMTETYEKEYTLPYSIIYVEKDGTTILYKSQGTKLDADLTDIKVLFKFENPS